MQRNIVGYYRLDQSLCLCFAQQNDFEFTRKDLPFYTQSRDVTNFNKHESTAEDKGYKIQIYKHTSYTYSQKKEV